MRLDLVVNSQWVDEEREHYLLFLWADVKDSEVKDVVCDWKVFLRSSRDLRPSLWIRLCIHTQDVHIYLEQACYLAQGHRQCELEKPVTEPSAPTNKDSSMIISFPPKLIFQNRREVSNSHTVLLSGFRNVLWTRKLHSTFLWHNNWFFIFRWAYPLYFSAVHRHSSVMGSTV